VITIAAVAGSSSYRPATYGPRTGRCGLNSQAVQFWIEGMAVMACLQAVARAWARVEEAQLVAEDERAGRAEAVAIVAEDVGR
jgi:hypothetical protein